MSIINTQLEKIFPPLYFKLYCLFSMTSQEHSQRYYGICNTTRCLWHICRLQNKVRSWIQRPKGNTAKL